MCLSNKERQQKYRTRIRRRVRGYFNFRCCSCFSKEELEFAHKEPCMLGKGRGGTLRYRLIYNNLKDFLLLCHDCHINYDSPKKII